MTTRFLLYQPPQPRQRPPVHPVHDARPRDRVRQAGNALRVIALGSGPRLIVRIGR